MPVTLADLKETFSLAGGNATPLVPKIIDRLLFEGVRRYAPMRRALPRMTWATDQYYFNSRTKLPSTQATTEAPSTTQVAATSSTYIQRGFPIKHVQTQLDISLFAAQVAKVNGDLFNLELAGAAKAHSYFEEMMCMYGTAGATVNTLRPQWDGADLLISNANKVDAANATFAIAMMDNAIDAIKGVAATELSGGDWFFLASPKMESAISRQFAQYLKYDMPTMRIFARDDYGNPSSPVGDNYLDAGFECASYRGIPIVISSFMQSVGSMSSVSASAAGTGSTLTASTTYYYVVEAVTRNGITTASVEASATPTSGQNITLTWTTPTILDVYGNAIDVFSYRIFRSTATGAETLYATVSALDATDTAITTFVDTGLPQNPYTTGSTLTAATVALNGSNAAPDGVTFPRIQSAGQITEDIYLIPRNPEYAVVPVVNEMTTTALAQINARTRQLALTSDETFALRAPGFAAKICRVRAI